MATASIAVTTVGNGLGSLERIYSVTLTRWWGSQQKFGYAWGSAPKPMRVFRVGCVVQALELGSLRPPSTQRKVPPIHLAVGTEFITMGGLVGSRQTCHPCQPGE